MTEEAFEPVPGARGPRLPDAATRSWAASLFVLFAIAYCVWYVVNLQVKAGASLADFALYVLQAVPAVSAILLPAALLIRHRDAWATARTLLFGTILYAAVQGLTVLANPLQGVFETLTPASEDLPFLVPMAAIYNGFISIVAALGLSYIALGLSMARRHEDRGPRSATAWFVPFAVVFGSIVGVLAVSRIQFGDTVMSPTLIVYLGSSVILGVVRIAVWALLASVATRGWLASEGPRPSWGMAALATGFVLFALALVNLSGLIDVPDDAFGTILGWVIVLTYAAGHLFLLGAFALGLPAIDADGFGDDVDDEDTFDDEEDEDDDEDFEDFEDEDDEADEDETEGRPSGA